MIRLKIKPAAAAAVLLVIFTLGMAGCGDDSPAAAVEEFVQASIDNDCEKVINMAYFGADVDSEMKDSLVEACKDTGLNPEGSELVSVETSNEKIDGDRATLTTKVTTRLGGEEVSEEQEIKLIKDGDEWKIDISGLLGATGTE